MLFFCINLFIIYLLSWKSQINIVWRIWGS